MRLYVQASYSTFDSVLKVKFTVGLQLLWTRPTGIGDDTGVGLAWRRAPLRRWTGVRSVGFQFGPVTRWRRQVGVAHRWTTACWRFGSRLSGCGSKCQIGSSFTEEPRERSVLQVWVDLRDKSFSSWWSVCLHRNLRFNPPTIGPDSLQNRYTKSNIWRQLVKNCHEPTTR